MTDKAQKICKEVKMVVNRRLNLLNGDYFDLSKEVDGFTNEIMDIVDSLQEEPVNIWHDAIEETPTQGSNVLMIRKEEKDSNYPPIAGCFHGESYPYNKLHWGYYNGFCYNEIEPPVRWAYIDEILKL